MSEFVVWMLGYPISMSLHSYINNLSNQITGDFPPIDKKKERDTNMVSAILWIGIGVLLYN